MTRMSCNGSCNSDGAVSNAVKTKLSPLSAQGHYVWIHSSLYCKIKLNLALLAVKDEGMLFMTDEVGKGTN